MAEATIEEIIAWVSCSHCNPSLEAEVAANPETWQNVESPGTRLNFQQRFVEEPHGKVIKLN
jgi:hypothetical protein